MNTVFCVLILNYLVTPQAASKGNSVNLALETVLEFDNKDIPSDVKIIDNVQKFLGKVRSILDKTGTRRAQRDGIKFTDFVENALIILRSFSDDDLQDLVTVLDDELRKYHYEGCKFYELVQNDDFREYISKNLEVMRATPAKELKIHIGNAQKKLHQKHFTDREKNFIEYINSLYSGNTSESMYSILQNLQQYNTNSKRNTEDLGKIVKEAIRTVVFDHYSSLNVNARKDLRVKVASYLNEYTGKDEKNDTDTGHSTVRAVSDTPDDSLMKVQRFSPVKEERNESEEVSDYTKEFSDNLEKRKPYISLVPEAITPKKKSLRLKQRTVTQLPMQTLWEEAIVASKRSFDEESSPKKIKKSKMVVREDKPLREILTEHNAVLQVISTHSTSTTSTKKRRHRHEKKRKSKRVTKTIEFTTEKMKKMPKIMKDPEHTAESYEKSVEAKEIIPKKSEKRYKAKIAKDSIEHTTSSETRIGKKKKVSKRKKDSTHTIESDEKSVEAKKIIPESSKASKYSIQIQHTTPSETRIGKKKKVSKINKDTEHTIESDKKSVEAKKIKPKSSKASKYTTPSETATEKMKKMPKRIKNSEHTADSYEKSVEIKEKMPRRDEKRHESKIAKASVEHTTSSETRTAKKKRMLKGTKASDHTTDSYEKSDEARKIKPKTSKASKYTTDSYEKSAEVTTRRQSRRRAYDQSLEKGLSIETFSYKIIDHPRRFLPRNPEYVYGKRSQRRREEHARWKQRYTTRKTTISTPDSNFLLKKISNLERELEKVKHRIDETTTQSTTKTQAAPTDLPYWEPKLFLKSKRTTTRTTTTEHTDDENDSENQEDLDISPLTEKHIVTIAPKHIVTTKKSTKTVPSKHTVTNKKSTKAVLSTKSRIKHSSALTKVTPTKTIKTTTKAATFGSIVFRSSVNDTDLPKVVNEKNTATNKHTVKLVEENIDEKRDLKEQIKNDTIKAQNAKNETIKLQENVKNFTVSKNKNTTTVNTSQTKEDGLNSTINEITTTNSTTIKIPTTKFYSLHKIVEMYSPTENNTDIMKKKQHIQ